MAKIKTLFLAANPKGTTELALQEEIREITYKIRLAGGDTLDVVSAWAVRPDDLLQYLNQHKPQIVHFSGHGSSSGEIILVDDKSGSAKPVSQQALKALFTTLKDNIQVVVLNACYSRIQGAAINEVIDFVVGMSTAIGDEAAIVFAASFYRALGFDRTLQEAFDQAKTALLLQDIPEENTPELLVRQGVSSNRKITSAPVSTDIELIKQFRKVFDRPAFRTPCIYELFIQELLEAVDDVQAAINTGRLYSRSGKLLGDVPDRFQFQSPQFQKAFGDIPFHLTQLKRQTVEFEDSFRQVHPSYSHHSNFYAMVMSLDRVADSDAIRGIVQQMDEIDEIRNQILRTLNSLIVDTDEKPFPLIELSSEVIRKGGFGGASSIARHLG